MKIRVISWNIAGGRPVNSDEQFDYAPENLEYFINQIEDLDPDIVCLQESHTNTTRSIAEEIAKKIGLKFVFNSINSPSHIDSEYNLGLAILSKEPILNECNIEYPYPSFKLLWPNGKEADIHHKSLQIINVGNFSIANTQMLPINIWGYDYGTSEGLQLAKNIEGLLLDEVKEPIIFCGDFNYNNPEIIYSNFIKKLQLKDAVNDIDVTRTSNSLANNKPDHIYYSSKFNLLDRKVIKTDTDHYLCFAEFSF